MTGYKVVRTVDIEFPEYKLLVDANRYIYCAIRELYRLPMGKSVLIELRGKSPARVQVKCHAYAVKFRMEVETHRTDLGIVCSRKRGAAPIGHRVIDTPECVVKSNERTKSPVPSGINGDSLTRRIYRRKRYSIPVGIQRPTVDLATTGGCLIRASLPPLKSAVEKVIGV